MLQCAIDCPISDRFCHVPPCSACLNCTQPQRHPPNAQHNVCTEMSDTILWCLVEGQSNHFPVHTSPTTVIGDLKNLIKKEREDTLRMVDGVLLGLWKVCYFYPFFLTLWVTPIYL